MACVLIGSATGCVLGGTVALTLGDMPCIGKMYAICSGCLMGGFVGCVWGLHKQTEEELMYQDAYE